MTLAETWAVLRRRARLVLMTVSAFLALALAYVVLTPTAYTASTLLFIDPRDRVPLGSEAQAMPQNPDTALIETQVKLLVSDAVLRKVVEEGVLGPPGPRSLLGAVADVVNVILGRGGAVGPDAAVTREVTTLGRSITAKRSERTYVIELEASASDPARAASIANAITRTYIRQQQDAVDDLADRQGDFVRKRLAELSARVEGSEAKVQRYRSDNGIVNASGTLVNEQQLADANRDLTVARAKTGEVQSRYDQIKRVVATGRVPETVGDALRSGVVERLRLQYADLARQEASLRGIYGPQHPSLKDIAGQLSAVKRQIDDELQRIVASAANDVSAAQANERTAEAQVNRLKTLSTSTNQTLLALKELEREADANRSAYERFLRTRENIRRDIIDSPFARVVMPAVAPVRPSSPRILPAFLVAAGAGLCFGIALAFARELIEREAPTPTNLPVVASLAPLPVVAEPVVARASPIVRRPIYAAPTARGAGVIATIPHLHRPCGDRASHATSALLFSSYASERAGPYGAAVRNLRDRLLRDLPRTNRPTTLLFTSAEAGIGKSTLAVALAQSIIELDQSVLLVDGNFHNPTLTESASLAAAHGFEVLAGFRRSATRRDGQAWLLPVGRPLTHPSGVSRLAVMPDLILVDGPSAEKDGALESLVEVPDAFLVLAPQAEDDAMAPMQQLDGVARYCGMVAMAPNGSA